MGAWGAVSSNDEQARSLFDEPICGLVAGKSESKSMAPRGEQPAAEARVVMIMKKNPARAGNRGWDRTDRVLLSICLEITS